MTAIAATSTQPAPSRPAYYDEIDPANEHYTGGGVIEGDLSFDDLIDVLNPLQHLPIVSTVYRAITGDQIQPHARAIGSGLYGGPIGFLAAGAAMAIEEAVGASPDAVLADLFDEESADGNSVVATAPDARPAVAAPASTAAAAVAAISAPPSQATAKVQADAPNSQAMFTIKDRPQFFALPNAADRRMPLTPRAPTELPLAPSTATVQAALTPHQAPTIGTTPTVSPEAPRPEQGLTAAQGNLLDRFVTGRNAGARTDPSANQSMPQTSAAPPLASGPSAEWIASQMQANLQKYAEAQRASNPGS